MVKIDTSFLESDEFKQLEGKYGFLAHAREILGGRSSDIDKEPFVVVDLETTGLDPVSNEIIEIGALKVEGGEVKDIFNQLVRPKAELSKEIISLTGITPEMLEGAPRIEEVLPDFLNFIDEKALIAHNVDFDIPFLKEHVKRALDKEINNRTVCTLKTSRALLPNLDNHKLHTVAHYFKVPISGRHRAIGDSEATYQVWLHLAKKLNEKNIKTLDELDKFILQSSPVNVPF